MAWIRAIVVVLLLRYFVVRSELIRFYYTNTIGHYKYIAPILIIFIVILLWIIE